LIKVKVIATSDKDTDAKTVFQILEMLIKNSQYSGKRVDKQHFNLILSRGTDPQINLVLKVKESKEFDASK
jgi:hypothetical protein